MEHKDQPEVKARNPNGKAEELGIKGSDRLKQTTGRQKGNQKPGAEPEGGTSERFRTRSKRMQRQASADKERAEKPSRFKQQGKARHAMRFAEEGTRTVKGVAAAAVMNDDDRDTEEQTVDEAKAKSGLAVSRKSKRLKNQEQKAASSKRMRYGPAFGKAENASKAAAKQETNAAANTAKTKISNLWKSRRWKQSARTTAAARKAAATGNTSALKGAQAVKAGASRLFTAVAGSKAPLVVAGVVIVLVLACASMAMTFMPLATGITQAMAATSYTATDEDIKSADAAYTQLEAGIEAKAQQAETSHPGYDEYRYQLDEVGHDPYALASILTARYGTYTASQVTGFLSQVLAQQYSLTFTPSEEKTTVTTTDADGNEVTEEKTVRILTVTLTNHGSDYAASKLLSDDEIASYQVTYVCKGNRDDLFAGSYASSGTGISYDYPPGALSDADFARMAAVIEQCIGTPYVWGGYSLSGFDCSGFVSWVLNQSGQASFGHLDCNGIMSHCTAISESQLKPGDIIFFQGTYDCAGASHIGIVIDPDAGIMAHCGTPCQYASYKTPYFQAHFLAFGRLSH